MKIVILFFLIINSVQADSIKVLNFNTMCDFCKGSNLFKYDERIKSLRRVIDKHQPDLMSLQEIRTLSQVERLTKNYPRYKIIATDSLLVSYADPAIVYDSEKLKLLETKNYWLGPNNGKFSFGWSTALPRQILIAKFKSKNKEFYFISSHFDNLRKNLKGASEVLIDIFHQFKLPTLFAGDTNIPMDMRLYTSLTSEVTDAFDLKENFNVMGEYKSDKDICYLKKGKVFPTCRVEHFLLSKAHDWKVKSFTIDANKYYEGKFPSDHRPYILDVEIP